MKSTAQTKNTYCSYLLEHKFNVVMLSEFTVFTSQRTSSYVDVHTLNLSLTELDGVDKRLDLLHYVNITCCPLAKYKKSEAEMHWKSRRNN